MIGFSLELLKVRRKKHESWEHGCPVRSGTTSAKVRVPRMGSTSPALRSSPAQCHPAASSLPTQQQLTVSGMSSPLSTTSTRAFGVSASLDISMGILKKRSVERCWRHRILNRFRSGFLEWKANIAQVSIFKCVWVQGELQLADVWNCGPQGQGRGGGSLQNGGVTISN